MSGAGRPAAGAAPVDARVALLAASWHDQVMDGLIAGATRACEDSGARWELIWVPGSFELPLACATAAATGRFDALVALGVVIRGGTPHFDYVCRAATDGITRVGLDSGVPIGFGLLTCDTEQQALDRAGLPDSSEDKGAEATHAALAMVGVIRALG
ncbi:MAG: 6,7-dimethyl-8-ribityllumazine synthase [Actinomycetota bacterium]